MVLTFAFKNVVLNTGVDGKDTDEETRSLGKPTDTVRLGKFLQRSGQVQTENRCFRDSIIDFFIL